MSGLLQEVYDRLYAAYGPQHWWPAQTPFEVIVGAVLVQNTNWKNVERAIGNLREAGLLEPRRLAKVPLPELEELIRPAGYYRIKARRLRNLLELIVRRYGGLLERMFSRPLDALREELLGVPGIGPETADSILLYAGGFPTFVVDTYTHRVLARHGWIGFDADYYQIKDFFESQLEANVQLFNEYHALLVRVGKLHCRRQPKCSGCPLEQMLPEGGPLEPEE
ncbi:MAG: endonuclease III domain-containing protein [Thermoguttaceae bacterium]|nr:endonuclease III domain-containing protein [Thermoguttaceae bacterium]MDW8038914.1 endonuclease III domain-containing protein [Thermoguttaceae bacterium]